MTIVLRIPDLVDGSLGDLKSQISSLQSRVSTMTNDLNALKTRGMVSPAAPGSAPSLSGPPGSPPPSPGAPPGAPPPPPGGPPGGPPGAPPPGPRPSSSPQSLRGAIMGELKQLFAKRKQ